MANVGNIAGVLKNSTALKPLMSTADDLAIYGLRYVNPDMNDANKAAKKFMDYKAAGRSLSEGATAAVVNYANHHKEQIGKEDGLFQALNPAVNTAESLMQYVVGADLAVNMGLPLLGGVVGVLGLKGVQETLNKPRQLLNPEAVSKAGNLTLGQKISSGVFIGFTAVGAYGVARTFSQNLEALRHMHSDISGIPVEKISSWSLLTGKVSPVVAEARSHLLREFIPKGLAQLGGLAWVISVARRSTASFGENIMSGMLPQLASTGIDIFMGESILPVYSGFANAYKSGKPLPAEAYAEFILAGNDDLKKRRVGRQVATELGTQFANEKTDPAEILREMDDGRFQARINQLISKDEAELTRQNALKQQKVQTAAPAPPVSMVDKVNGAKPERQAIGKFTGMLHDEKKGLPQGLNYHVT